MASGQVGGEAFVHTASVCYPSLGQISGHQGGILLWQSPILPPLSPSGPQAVSPTHAWSSHYSPSELCGGCCYILVTTFCFQLRAFAHTVCCLEISLAWLYLTIQQVFIITGVQRSPEWTQQFILQKPPMWYWVFQKVTFDGSSSSFASFEGNNSCASGLWTPDLGIQRQGC